MRKLDSRQCLLARNFALLFLSRPLLIGTLVICVVVTDWDCKWVDVEFRENFQNATHALSFCPTFADMNVIHRHLLW